MTIAHSRTRDLPAVCRRADVLFVAIGKPEFVQGDWIKPGATVIDVGINRVPTPDGNGRLVGDVAFAEAVKIAGAITPLAGRRRADDDRVFARQYVARGLHARGTPAPSI